MTTIKFKREPAKRVFAAELNQITETFKADDGDMAPTYALLPTGERCARVLVAGILTKKDTGRDKFANTVVHIADPTGSVYVKAGEYQPAAKRILNKLTTKTPQYLAIFGVPKVWKPVDKPALVSVEAKTVYLIDKDVYSHWVYDTARAVVTRVENMGCPNSDTQRAAEVYPQFNEVYWLSMAYDAMTNMYRNCGGN